MVDLTADPIDTAALQARVSGPGNGAVLVFLGVARNHNRGREVLGLEYEAYGPMALAEMARIEAEALARWPGAEVAMVHRTGLVGIGEASVVIAVGSPHRAEAYETSRFLIDQLKARVPVWKRERYADGSDWIANRS
jgi:molybdopterin synthase catalytic subunit